jgi:hypothetical protein
MANYPLITWQVDAPGFEVDGNPTGALGTKWGFKLDSFAGDLGNGAPDSLAGAFADAIVTYGGATSAEGIYVVNNSVGPAMGPVQWVLTFTEGPYTVVFNSLADAAVYGFDATTVTFTATPSAATPYNVAGVWMPCGVSGDVTRVTKQRAAVSSSEMSGLSTDVVNWGHVADIEVRSTLFPVANAFVWYAGQSIYATKAGRLVGDPNNILEVMLQAASTGVEFNIYEQAATTAGLTNEDYLEAKMPSISGKSAATDFLQADDEPRLWSAAGIFFRGNT